MSVCRCNHGVALGIEEANCPLDHVRYPLSWRLALYPKFQIFWAVICAVTVLMVNRFVFRERSSENLFHDLAVLHDRSSLLTADDIAAPMLWAPTINTFSFPRLFLTRVAAGLRTETSGLVSGIGEFLAAVSAFSLFLVLCSARCIAAFFRAGFDSIGRHVARERLSAHDAYFLDSGSFRHFDVSSAFVKNRSYLVRG